MECDISSIRYTKEFDNTFIENTLEQLTKIKDYIGMIQKEYNNLVNLIKKYIDNKFSNEFFEIIDIIDKYSKFLKDNDSSKKDKNIQENKNFYNNLKIKCNKFNDDISSLVKENFLQQLMI